jgi:hypothetical protein
MSSEQPLSWEHVVRGAYPDGAVLLNAVIRRALENACAGLGGRRPAQQRQRAQPRPPDQQRLLAQSPPDVGGCPAPQVVCSLHVAAGRDLFDYLWWGRALEVRAESLAEVFAIRLLTMTVSEHVVSLAVIRRPDVAAAWDDDEVDRRVSRLAAARNIFAHEATPCASGVSTGAIDRSSPERSLRSSRDRWRRVLSCDRAFRKALIRWVWRRRSIVSGRPESFAPGGVRATSPRIGDPSLIAAVGLIGLECAAMRQRWLAMTESHADQMCGPSGVHSGSPIPDQGGSGFALADLGAAERLRQLTHELRNAKATRWDRRPLTLLLRQLLGDERFDSIQRGAVQSIAGLDHAADRRVEGNPQDHGVGQLGAHVELEDADDG